MSKPLSEFYFEKSSAFFNSIFVLLCLVIIANGQGFGDRTRMGGTGGNNSIQGRIYLPTDNPISGFRVKLESTNAPTITTFTDSEGIFHFSSLEAGHYSIVIDSTDNYESARETMTIDRQLPGESTSKTFNLVIYLRPKNTAQAKPGVIRAEFASVPKPALEKYDEALKAVRSNETEKAIQLFNAAIAIYPQFAEAYSQVGILYIKKGDLDKAFEFSSKALQLDSRNFNAKLNSGIVLVNRRKWDEAEKILRQALIQKEGYAPLYMYLGISLIGLNKLDEAETELLKSVSLKSDENVALAHKYLGALYWQKKRFTEAADELEKYVKLNPKGSDAERIKGTIKELRSKTK